MKNYSHYLANTTWSDKAIIDPSMPIVGKVQDDVVDIDNAP